MWISDFQTREKLSTLARFCAYKGGNTIKFSVNRLHFISYPLS